MSRVKILVSVVLAVALVVPLMTGCGGSSSSTPAAGAVASLIGAWIFGQVQFSYLGQSGSLSTGNGITATLTLNADNTFTFTAAWGSLNVFGFATPADNVTVSGTYSTTGANISFVSADGNLTATYSIAGNTLTISGTPAALTGSAIPPAILLTVGTVTATFTQ